MQICIFQPRPIFSCALGAQVSKENSPALYRLLQRSLTDLGLATYPAKKAHMRERPFLVNNEAICTPDERELLETDGSYPSGHSAIGWGWALILSQLAPDHAEALLARGRAYAQSRMVCNCLLYTSPSPRDGLLSRMPSSA